MENGVFPQSPMNQSNWSPSELIEQEPAKKKGLLPWWYSLTAVPDVPANASFVRRESARKSHLLSTIVFWMIISFVLFIPACFVVPNHYIIYIDLGMIVVCVLALWCNRAQKVLLAGMLLTFAFELALTAVIFTTQPLDEPSIQQYELFVFGELLSVSLLAPSSVFAMMSYNVAIITASLLLQKHTGFLDADLHTQFAAMWVRPIAVQLLVAFVSFLWVKGAVKAIARADRAEMVAKLEHELVEQRQQLENGIQQILQTHVEVANGNLNARAPLNQENILWQIARSLNTLLVRLQRATLSERQLQRVQLAVRNAVQTVQEAEQQEQPPRLSLTQTEIDPLIVALQGKTLAYGPSPAARQQSPQASRSRSYETGPHGLADSTRGL